MTAPPPMEKATSGSVDGDELTIPHKNESTQDEDEVKDGSGDTTMHNTWSTAPQIVHNGNAINWTGDTMEDKKRGCLAWFALALSIIALIVSILGTSIIAGILHKKISNREDTMTTPDLQYEGMEGKDEGQDILVGDYYGWQYLSWRAVGYKDDTGYGYDGGNDIQYPFHDLHVRYGDTLIFKV